MHQGTCQHNGSIPARSGIFPLCLHSWLVSGKPATMLGEIGIAFLIIMVVAYLAGLPVNLYCLFSCLVRKRFLHALKTLVYLVLVTFGTLLCILPFLKMHGSYTDTERLAIIALCAANLGFILLVAFTRYGMVWRLKENQDSHMTGTS